MEGKIKYTVVQPLKQWPEHKTKMKLCLLIFLFCSICLEIFENDLSALNLVKMAYEPWYIKIYGYIYICVYAYMACRPH